MSADFLDANVILRHVLGDDPIQSPAAYRLIQAIEQGQTTVWTTNLTIAETVWVLSSKQYNLSRERIRDLLLPLINLPGIKMPHKRLYKRVFDLYTTLPIDYIDCYHAALMERRKDRQLYSFDTDFDQVTGLKRVEP